MNRRRTIIIEARRIILDVLNSYHPNAPKVQTLLRYVLPVQPEYDMTLCSKDLHYLQSKGYLVIRPPDKRLALSDAFSDRLVDITAAGKEIAEKIIDDPALEI